MAYRRLTCVCVLDDCCCLFVFVDEEGIRQGAAYACVDTRGREKLC